MIIVQQIAAQLLTPTISHELMHTDC
jgi:hypothetical protein